MKVRRFAALPAVFFLLALFGSTAAAQKPFTIEQVLSYSFPSDLVSAARADRICWFEVQRGLRNVYTAAAPSFKPVRLTDFRQDDGAELADLRLSADGSVAVFVRGQGANREGWIANPSSDPTGGHQIIWAVDTRKGKPFQVTEGESPALSPDGKWVLFAREGQIYEAPVRAQNRAGAAPQAPETPLIKAWGYNRDPQWSPDGRKIAFVSTRQDHSLIAVYDRETRRITYMSPSVDRDTAPSWSPDGKRIAFLRRPGLPFARSLSQSRSTGPGYYARRGRENPSGRGSQGQAQIASGPGFQEAAFRDGSTLQIWAADAATGAGQEIWHNPAGDESYVDLERVRNIRWADGSIVFQLERNNWRHYYSIPVEGDGAEPIDLTPGEGIAESVAFSSDGKYLVYSTNVGDIDRRHLWKTPTAGGTPLQLTKGEGIEVYPAVLASGGRVACFYADAFRPLSPATVAADGGKAEVINKLPDEFPLKDQVAPEQVILTAEDGLKFHTQVFTPKDIKPGERRPAVLFTHGGPIRQMLLGYHYMYFYHMAYAMNQYFASQGYVVISVNYRSGIGYGREFRTAPDCGRRGSAEYRDVVAAARYLQSRPDVDSDHIGLYGLSYGGLLTAMGLARNSDIFAAGVDIAGVHLWGNSLDPENTAFKASSVSTIDKWTSPVLLVQGDDDRNVAFSQTVGLVQLLRPRNVHYELMVFPDEVHDFLVFGRWLKTFKAADDFFNRFLRNGEAPQARK